MRRSKKFVSLLIALLMLITIMPANAFAKENSTDLFFFPEVKSYNASDDDIEILSPNLISIYVNPRVDGTGVDVKVGNLGLDGLDSVTVTVSATGHAKPQSQKAYVPAIIGKTFAFNMPMIKSETTYDVTASVIDGSGTVTKTGKGTLTLGDSTLQSAGWHKGTFTTRAASLDYHFDKHKSEVGAGNIVIYLNLAATYRDEIVNDITSGTTSKYTITTGTGSIPSKKYKHKTDLRFAILTNTGYEILSFGR